MSYDYTIPCGDTKVHPDGICRKKLHRNISHGLTRAAQRHEKEELEAQMAEQKASLDEQRRHLDLQEKMLGVGMGTHRVIEEKRKKFKPKAKPFVPGAEKPKSKPSNKKNP